MSAHVQQNTQSAWEAAVRDAGQDPADLWSTTIDDVDLAPVLFAPDESSDGAGARASAWLAGRRADPGWQILTMHTHPDAQSARLQIQADVAGGVDGLVLPATALGLYTTADVHDFLRDTPKHLSLHLRPGQTPIGSVAVLASWLEGHERIDGAGSWGLDPLGTLAATGTLSESADLALDRAAAVSARLRARFPNMRTMTADAIPYHYAGATDVDDLAIVAATTAEYLRRLIAVGVDVEEASDMLAVTLPVGGDQWIAAAKLRAARVVLGRIVELFGGGVPPAVTAVTSPRVYSARAFEINILRSTVAAWAAAVGGADALVVLPHDVAAGDTSAVAQRLARNVQHIVAREAGLGEVSDPARGSWYLESLTRQLAEHAWDRMQEIERVGGVLDALRSGWIADAVAEARAERLADVASRRRRLVGINDWVAPQATSAERTASNLRHGEFSAPAQIGRHGDQVQAAIDAAAEGQSAAAIEFAIAAGIREEADPLPLVRIAEDFEQLQEAAAQADVDVHVAVVAMSGGATSVRVNVAWVRNVLAAGGLVAEPVHVIDAQDSNPVDRILALLAGTKVAVLVGVDAFGDDAQDVIDQVCVELDTLVVADPQARAHIDAPILWEEEGNVIDGLRVVHSAIGVQP